MESLPRPTHLSVHLGEDALTGIAATLADLYELLYGERPLDSRASLSGNTLAWVFDDGLTVADEGLMRRGREPSLREFRLHFFDAVGEQFDAVVGDLTGVPLDYSFFGFDPSSRTTHGVFVLDPRGPDLEQRRALRGWSEQVRLNARRLRREHAAIRDLNQRVRRQIGQRREEFERELGRAGERPEDYVG